MLRRICKAQKLMDKACEGSDRDINIMEVCGTHTVSIFRNGIRAAIPPDLKLISGPGCPVCVTDQSYIDNVIDLADRDDCILATFGDMIRVPGRNGSLEKRNRNNIRIIVSGEDALEIAKQNPDKSVIFLAIGFETTAPSTAVIVKEAHQQNIKNLHILSGHKRVVPAMKALLKTKNSNIDGFLCPGHVSAVTGFKAFEPVVKEFNVPCVVAGFDPMQIIEGIAEICRQISENKPELTSIYESVVTEYGNQKAVSVMNEVFDEVDGYWRGLGRIENSVLNLKDEYKHFDAAIKYNLDENPANIDSNCKCGDVITGIIDPEQCGLYGNDCTPEEPHGPCMVSSEGSCAAWYKYSRRRRKKA